MKTRKEADAREAVTTEDITGEGIAAKPAKAAGMDIIKNGLLAAGALMVVLVAIVLVYFGIYYHAGDAAMEAMEGTSDVVISQIDEGYLFDGVGTETALIFYPGAKVEAVSYAPLMQGIAESGTDCFLCTMPLNFALADKDRACRIQEEYEDDYENWYLAGHSLGGAAAAMLAESGIERWNGLILLAAYPTDSIWEPTLSVYGSEDEVLNSEKYNKAASLCYWSDDTGEVVIQGGNHAQFGDYGAQKGDGTASITAEQQQRQTVDAINEFIERVNGYDAF